MFRIWFNPRVKTGDTGEPCSVRVNDEILFFSGAGELETENQALVAQLQKDFNSLFTIEEFEAPKVKDQVVVGDTIEEKDELPSQEDRTKAEIVSTEPKLAIEEMIEEEKALQNFKDEDTAPEVPKLKLKLGRKKKRR